MIVYKIVCKVNGKIYIGQTSETKEKRFKRHMGYQKNDNDTKFYRAVRKYGVENFYIIELDNAETQEELDEKEFFWINNLDSINLGYNTKSTKGKCGGDTLTNHPDIESICKKLSISKMGDKNPMRIYGGLKGKRNGMYGKRGIEVASSRKCVAISVLTGQEIYFDTLTGIKEYFNVTTLGMVSSRCSGRVKAPYKGYYFKYYEDHIESQSTIES